LPAAQPAPNGDMMPVALKPVARVQSDSSGFSWIPLQTVAAKKHPHPPVQPAPNDSFPWMPLRTHEE
jgi:hypothetical protein